MTNVKRWRGRIIEGSIDYMVNDVVLASDHERVVAGYQRAAESAQREINTLVAALLACIKSHEQNCNSLPEPAHISMARAAVYPRLPEHRGAGHAE